MHFFRSLANAENEDATRTNLIAPSQLSSSLIGIKAIIRYTLRIHAVIFVSKQWLVSPHDNLNHNLTQSTPHKAVRPIFRLIRVKIKISKHIASG